MTFRQFTTAGPRKGKFSVMRTMYSQFLFGIVEGRAGLKLYTQLYVLCGFKNYFNIRHTCLISEAVVQSCYVKKVFLEIPQNLQENTRARDSFLIKLQALDCKKESLAQVFSCEFREISKNTFFYRTPSDASFVCKDHLKVH